MSIEEIKSVLAALPEKRQNLVAAYLTHLRHTRDNATRGRVTARNRGRREPGWITKDDLGRHWGQ